MGPQRRIATALAVLVPALASIALTSCQSAYFATMEKFGYAKREILVDRVEDAKEEQKDAKEQFVSTYERFKAVTGIQGGKLEETYEKLDDSYEDCRDQADAVREKIQSVEDVADAMFSEWKTEIGQYSDPALKRTSQESLDQTKRRYADLVGSMKRASASMDPVLAAFKDRVLFLKHNLNAAAISSLQDEAVRIQTDVAGLVAEMQKSIDEADRFISSLPKNE